MNNRGPHRGVLQQSAPLPRQRGNQGGPVWRPVPLSGVSTAPQPLRPTNGDSRQTTSSAHFDLPTVSTPVLDRPQPVQRDRRPGGTALDVIEQQFAPETPAPRNWRELIQRYVGIDLGPGRTAAYENALRDQVRTAVGGAYPIAVLNLKGGVGKTAVVEALGSTFASVRNDRVIAVDLDAGDLADRHGRRHDLTLADLIHDNRVARYADVRAHTFMNSSGLEVLGLPDPAHSNFCISRQDFVKAFSILRSHYSVVLIDCPKTLNSGVMDAVLLESRALVVVTSTSIDSIQKTSATLEWLSRNGYRKLVAATVLAVNHVERTKLSPLAAKQLEQLSAQVAATVVLPFDGHVHQGREIGLDLLSKVSRRSYLELAAALARLLPCRQPAGL